MVNKLIELWAKDTQWMHFNKSPFCREFETKLVTLRSDTASGQLCIRNQVNRLKVLSARRSSSSATRVRGHPSALQIWPLLHTIYGVYIHIREIVKRRDTSNEIFETHHICWTPILHPDTSNSQLTLPPLDTSLPLTKAP